MCAHVRLEVAALEELLFAEHTAEDSYFHVCWTASGHWDVGQV